MMSTKPRNQNTRIELELSRDVLIAMRGFGKPDVVQQTLKVALAVFLFQEGMISLGKAVELAGMHRSSFILLLQKHGLAAYEYTDQDFEWDQEAVVAYRNALPS
jgi:predicted HTH domain antitoxin